MKNRAKYYPWVKIGGTLAVLAVILLLVPDGSLDPWGLFNLKKISLLIFSLVAIQFLAEIFVIIIGKRSGKIIAGFLSGLISSTALTASLVRKSKDGSKQLKQNNVEYELMFFSGTLAMLVEVMLLTFIGLQKIYYPLFILLAAPILTTVLIIYFKTKSTEKEQIVAEHQFEFVIMPVLKLSLFIICILALTNILQKIFGQSGLMILTFLASLFEMHGAVIANIQLHNSGSVSYSFLGSLLVLSITASYVSKIFLISFVATATLRKSLVKTIFAVLIVLFFSWALFNFFYNIV